MYVYSGIFIRILPPKYLATCNMLIVKQQQQQHQQQQ
jgi:hypothetical protein